MGRVLTVNTPLWVRPSIGFLRLHGHYPREVADLHAYTGGGGQSVVSKRRNESGDVTLPPSQLRLPLETKLCKFLASKRRGWRCGEFSEGLPKSPVRSVVVNFVGVVYLRRMVQRRHRACRALAETPLGPK